MAWNLFKSPQLFKGPVKFLSTVEFGAGSGIDLSGVIPILGADAVAAAGSGQSTFTALTKQVNAVTGADGTKGVALPAAVDGKCVFILNTDQASALKVAPINSGNDQINSLTASTGVFTMGPGQGGFFIPISATQWYCAGMLAIAGTPTEEDLDGLLATVAEINRACDVSTRIVALNATSLAVTEALHDGKTIRMDHTAALSTLTLPAATGSGARIRCVVGAVNVNSHKIQVTGDDTMNGGVTMLDNDANAITGYAAIGGDDTITLNGTTTGGQVGDWVEFEDIVADKWTVRGHLVVPAGSNVADPFTNAAS